jgi:hypothetical protein
MTGLWKKYRTSRTVDTKCSLSAFLMMSILVCIVLSGNALSQTPLPAARPDSLAFPTGFDVFMSPSRPTVAREEGGHFSLQHNPSARSWVMMDRAGVSFRFQAYISREDSTEVSLKIFDSFGSEVATAVPDKTNYLRDIDTNFNRVTIVSFYWNGTTTHSPSTYVHEGIYSAELQFLRKNEKDPIKFKQNFYMEKPESGHSTCGGNYSIAFMPALWLKSRRPLLRAFLKIMKNMRGTR